MESIPSRLAPLTARVVARRSFPPTQLLRCRHVSFTDVEVGGDLLHIVVVFERFH